ncbi:MAG: chorismate mutase [Saprospiraceae bacterium]
MSWINTDHRPYLISGPCSAETESQVIETAIRLSKTGRIHALRAGIWKPRTRPGAFEGIGEKGLPWLSKAKEITGIPTMVEVARAQHVDACLKEGIDMLWIGARTTVNPFAVQEIAEALRGIDIPIFLKNPVSPDLDLWIGGMERLINIGLTRVAAIHRGFYFSGEKIYRNRPQWQLAIDFKTAMPNIPMINDPSHICGNRDLLFRVAQQAIDLEFDGLMIESHIDPDHAWSDAAQQITPEQYGELINNLVIRHTENQASINEIAYLDRLRKEIDLLDDEIIHILNSRMKIVRDIGHYKKDHDIVILQTSRWKEILEKFLKKGINSGLTEEFITKIIKSIHDESIAQQEKIMNSGDSAIIKQ